MSTMSPCIPFLTEQFSLVYSGEWSKVEIAVANDVEVSFQAVATYKVWAASRPLTNEIRSAVFAATFLAPKPVPFMPARPVINFAEPSMVSVEWDSPRDGGFPINHFTLYGGVRKEGGGAVGGGAAGCVSAENDKGSMVVVYCGPATSFLAGSLTLHKCHKQADTASSAEEEDLSRGLQFAVSASNEYGEGPLSIPVWADDRTHQAGVGGASLVGSGVIEEETKAVASAVPAAMRQRTMSVVMSPKSITMLPTDWVELWDERDEWT